MKELTLIFPHQLFQNHPALYSISVNKRPVLLVEEWLFFKQYHFHQQKLVLHRASMQYYKNWLTTKGFEVEYIHAFQDTSDIRLLIPALAKKGIQKIHLAQLVDNWLEKRLTNAAIESGITLDICPSPNFITNANSANLFFNGRKTYFQTDFYTYQRKQQKIMVDDRLQPLGGKWTYDADNRARFPKGEKAPQFNLPADNQYVYEAREYVKQYFSQNPGTTNAPFEDKCEKNHFYPISFEAADDWLEQFMQNRFAQFGIYEDAMVASEPLLNHSLLSPLMNIGLLNPQNIIDKALTHAAANNIPLNSLEGFVRQIIGWREFIKIVYEREGSFQRTRNYWNFSRKIPASFWNATTGIVPVDNAIEKVLKSGYNHHIERLMILGNFMLLCEFDPNEVYRWFMEMYIDSYDWVMVPNIYGMTQFADGGLMTTKPYISGSNYILKMSDYTKGPWQEIWDGLFWRFMHIHRSFFLKNPRLGMLVHTFDKMSEEKKNTHLSIANQYLAGLDKSIQTK